MKPLPDFRLLLLGLSIGIFSCSSSKYATTGTSEYDDLYFNNSDRYPVMTDGTTTVVQRADTDGGIGVGYDSKTLNPDYGLPQDAVVENEYAEDEYYVEDHDDQYMDKAIDDYLRNNSTARRYTNPRYYNDFDDVFWSDPMYYSGTIFDPLYRSYYGVYSPFAYNSYYRPYSSFYRPWGPRITVSLGFGYGFGSPYWGRYYDPFYYGGGFGYGYGYYSPYRNYYGYYGNAWCPPSYYGGYNNTVVINNIENSSGNVRYGTRQPRGSSYIVNNSRTQNTASPNSSTIRSRADNAVRSGTQRTLDNNRVVERNTSNIRTRNADQINPANGANTRFRTHSLDSKSNYDLNDRSSNLQQRSNVNRNAYRTPDRGNQTQRSLNRSNNNYSSSPSRSGTRQLSPNKNSSSESIRNRGSYNRPSSPSPSRNYSAPSRTRSSSSSPSRSSYSAPSRSQSYSAPSRSSSPSPSRSTPSRTGGARSITR
jgi:hypothetical protein